jgi:hypothetical protein
MRTLIEDIVAGDAKYYLNFTLQDENGEPLNLTDATIKLKAQKPGDDELKVDSALSVVSAIAGTCRYLVLATDFDVAHTYNAEIEVTYTNGTILTYPDILIKVQSDLPK